MLSQSTPPSLRRQIPEADTHPLVRRLQSVVDLGSEERTAIRDLPMMVRELRADQDIVREGDHPSQCCILLEGMAFRYKIIGEGRRQIFAFHAPGEVPDLQSLFLKRMDHSLCTLTPVKAGFVRHDALRELLAGCPRVAGALWRETLIESAIFREWMAGLGRRDALTRVAHLFCEMYIRLDAIGRARDGKTELPITQNELADALGISDVHANRTLQELRGRNLITFERGALTIHDWEGLAAAGEFDPAYLHQNPDAESEAV